VLKKISKRKEDLGGCAPCDLALRNSFLIKHIVLFQYLLSQNATLQQIRVYLIAPMITMKHFGVSKNYFQNRFVFY
jgi:hypothetical protein